MGRMIFLRGLCLSLKKIDILFNGENLFISRFLSRRNGSFFGKGLESSFIQISKYAAALPLSVKCATDPFLSIPAAPTLPEVIPSLNSLGEPTFSSLGLNSYWPSGWYQALLESLHVNMDLPWWLAIASTTIVIRMCLVPLIIDQRRKLASYTNSMPKIMELQNKMTKARIASNYIEMMKISQEMQTLMQNKDINPLRSMRLLIVQVPIFLSVFAGLRGMASLPVESLMTGGMGWFSDLTVCDPFYILPFYSMASIFLMFEFGADVSSQNMTPTIKLMMRGFPVVGFFMIMHMPSALLWYWSISNTISITQALVLKTHRVRTYLKLPEMAKPKPQEKDKKGFVEGFRASMTNSRLIAEIEARERNDAERWQKAGISGIPKTFSYDPTAARQKPIINVKGTTVQPNMAQKN